MSEGKIERVEDMPVFQVFYRIALEVERLTRDFRSDFRWLRGQLLRSSESVCANMTEGFYAQYSTEYRQSLFRCRREARETMLHLRYANDVGILTTADYDKLERDSEDGLHQLSNVIGSIDRKIRMYGKSKPDAMLREELADYEADDAMNHQPLTINHFPHESG